MTKSLISVCCLAYNHEQYIRQALDGILMQKTEYPFEVVIHDDASTDRTSDIIREYEKKYPEIIKPIYQKENQHSQGVSIFSQWVFPRAQGKYVAWLECDDYWTDPNKLQRQVSYMENHPECSGTFHAANWLVDEKIIKNDRHSERECDVTPQQVICGGGEFCASASLCFRMEYALDRPCFRVCFPVGDYPLQILLSLRGRFHYFPQTMSCYRFGRPGSWTGSMRSDERKIQFLKKEIRAFKLLDEYTNYMYSTEIYYRITKDQSDLYAKGAIPFSEIRESFEHMEWGHMKLSRMRRCYDRFLRRYLPGIKQKY